MKRVLIAILALAPLLSIGAPTPSFAEVCGPGDVGDIDMSCEGLWHERNRVFAEHGFCFKSDRALRAFGPGCVPPYGALEHNDRCYVQAIKQIEREQGCPVE